MRRARAEALCVGYRVETFPESTISDLVMILKEVNESGWMQVRRVRPHCAAVEARLVSLVDEALRKRARRAKRPGVLSAKVE